MLSTKNHISKKLAKFLLCLSNRKGLISHLGKLFFKATICIINKAFKILVFPLAFAPYMKTFFVNVVFHIEKTLFFLFQ